MRFQPIAAIILLGSLLSGAAAADVELVAESGVQAPGEAAGVNFSRFRAPVIGGAGHVAFWARLLGPGISPANSEAVFTGVPGSLRKVMQKGAPAPGTAPGVEFSAIPTNVTVN